MYLGFSGYASLLHHYESVNPGRTKIVVLLVHPEMLRGAKPISSYLSFVSDLYAGTDHNELYSFAGDLRGFFGLHIFQGRFLARCPVPLSGEYRHYYGFNLGLYRFLQRHNGSAVDPHEYVPGPGQGNAEYRLASSIEPDCHAFRAGVPEGAKLLVGLAPIPRSFATPGHEDRIRQILLGWGQWIGAECLTNLPTILPDNFFASTTHLNSSGSDTYTAILATNLQPHLPQP